jgi:hypothetical protein
MKASEILRKLADMIDTHGDGEDSRPANSVPHAELEPVEVDHTDHTETTKFVAPLQAKFELLKKSLGMDNAYDNAYDNNADSEEPCDSEEDAELALIKQRAGVPVIAVQEMADDDGPFEG